MKINNSMIKQLSLQNEKNSGAVKKNSEEAAREQKNLQESKNVNISISKQAEILERARTLFKETSEVNMDKVDYYKNLIKSGQYEVSSDALADSILKSFDGGKND